ncbi:MAG: transglutaminase-like domain-containing protein [Chloroflexota bacterium]
MNNKTSTNLLLMLLLIMMVISPASAMRWAGWVPGLWVLQGIAFLSVLTGTVLATSRFGNKTVGVFAFIYGIFIVGLFSGFLVPEGLSWHEKIAEMAARQAKWFSKAISVILDPDATDISRDGLIFIMQTGALIWLFGIIGAWSTFRRLNSGWAVIPSGVLLLLTVINYHGREALGLVLIGYVVVAVLYSVTTHYHKRETDWQNHQVVFGRETRWSFLQAGFIAALLIIPFSWLIPKLDIGQVLRSRPSILEPSIQRVQDGWNQLFASLKSTGTGSAQYYGGRMVLGGPRHIEPVPVMKVQANWGRYWRSTSYDTYTGEGWVNSTNTRIERAPDNPIQVPEYQKRLAITSTITNQKDNIVNLYFPHQPTATDRQARFNVWSIGNALYDIESVLSRFGLYSGRMYKTHGTVSYADYDQLRTAGNTYPEWVAERYLQLPDEFSSRVRDLARTITAGAETPYDQAELLTHWLRDNLTYNDNINAPPPGSDPIEYLLFESREGYCNYYATALAVMLRSIGVPARVVSGYTQGTWVEDGDFYRVFSDDSHAWVEVFFPEYGWLEFEPTVTEAVIGRAPPGTTSGAEEADLDLQTYEEEPEMLTEDDLLQDRALGGLVDRPEPVGRQHVSTILTIGIILGIAALVAAAFWYFGLRRSSDMSWAAFAYDRIMRIAQWLGVRFSISETPFERAAKLTATAPETTAPVDVITDLYVEESFSQVDAQSFGERAELAFRQFLSRVARRLTLYQLARIQRKKD